MQFIYLRCLYKLFFSIISNNSWLFIDDCLFLSFCFRIEYPFVVSQQRNVNIPSELIFVFSGILCFLVIVIILWLGPFESFFHMLHNIIRKSLCLRITTWPTITFPTKKSQSHEFLYSCFIFIIPVSMYLFALFSFTTFTFSFNPFGDIRQNFIFILLSIHVCWDWTEPNLMFVSTKVEIYLIPFELAILSYQRIFNLWDFINNLICNLIYNWIYNLIILLNYMIHCGWILQ